jgi:hypothetical protein
MSYHLKSQILNTFSPEMDKMTAVPGSYCQFSFAGHLLKVGLYVGGQVRGMASVNLVEVVREVEWAGGHCGV